MHGKPFSIAVKGSGPHMGMYITHGMTRWPTATFYDRSPMVNAFRQQEVKLGQAGHLDAAGTASAQRTAQNMASPPKTDVTLEFIDQNGMLFVNVICGNGRQTRVGVDLATLMGPQKMRGFAPVDNAIAGCQQGPAAMV